MFGHFSVGFVGVTSLSLSCVLAYCCSDTPNTQQDVNKSALMRAKLSSTQRIVDGLVSKNFDDIIRGSEEIIKICQAEEWKAHQDGAYGHHRRELMLQAGKMIDAAERESLDGAAYYYINALTTCISCHDHCRDVLKIAQNDKTNRIVHIPTVDDTAVPRSR